MQLHGLVKAEHLTEKDNSVLNDQASLSLIHKHWLDSSTGKDKVTKYHIGAPLPTGVTWGIMVMLGLVQPSLLPLPPGLLCPGAVDCSQGCQHREAG